MKYSIRVNEVKNRDGNLKGFATVVFDDSFKVTNIAILENQEKGQLFVFMPRYRNNERDDRGMVYKDVCNPITKEFREELYGNILEAFENLQKQEHDKQSEQAREEVRNAPDFSVSVTLLEREGSNIKGLARIYFDDCFIVNNVTILQGKESLFVAMPSYKTKQTDEQGKAVYQEVCYPVTKEFREKLYQEILSAYDWELRQQKDKHKNQKEVQQGSVGQSSYDRREPFR